MARRRSPRLHPQTQASEEGAGVTPRRSSRLHPQIQANEGAGVIRRHRRRGTSPAATASLPDDDDMLREILLRLPPQPSSLPHASAVCRRWRGLVSDPKFHRQFCAHHRKPPLLGVFSWKNKEGIVFNPIPDPPDRIPPRRLSLGRYGNTKDYDMLDCRHGLVLVREWNLKDVAVCDPITGQQRCLAVPSELRRVYLAGAVLCAAGDHCQVHGGCHSSPFKVVLVSTWRRDNQPLACVYSSDNGIWGDIISTDAPCQIFDADPGMLIGSALYWLCMSDHMLEFHLVEHNLAVISVPPLTSNVWWRPNVRQIIQAEDGAVCFAMLSYPRFQMWQRNVDGHGVPTWMPWKTIEMHAILGIPFQIEARSVRLLGYDEDSDEIYLQAGINVYRVQLKLMHSRKLYGTQYINPYYPFKSFYMPAIREYDEAGMLHNP